MSRRKKNTCKCYVNEEIGHFTNQCRNKNNNKIIEALGSLDYVELDEEEALELTLENNKGIIELIEEEIEIEDGDYSDTDEELNFMMTEGISIENLKRRRICHRKFTRKRNIKKLNITNNTKRRNISKINI